MVTVTLVAAVATVCALLLLAWRDPATTRAATRGRSPDGRAGTWSPRQRLMLGIAATAPGAGLAVSGEWAAFAVWLGLLSFSGWLTARAARVLAQR